MTSEALIAMIEDKLKAYGLKKVIPDEELLAETYRGFRRSDQLRAKFEEMEAEFDAEADAVKVPKGMTKRVRDILTKHADLRWDDAVRIVLNKSSLDQVREDKAKARKKSGDFTDGGDEESDDGST